MKTILKTCLAFLLLFQLGLVAQAQNYQPFRKGPTYHFIARDSIYSMRIDTAKVVGGDSVFVFNPTVKAGIIRTGKVSCVGRNTLYHAQTNNQFGHWMKEHSNGDYIFHSAQGKEFLIKTQSPLNSSWTFSSNPNITATLVSQTMDTINGVTDLIKTINLSNGTQIKLSKNYGFVQVPNFMAFVPNSDFNPRTLIQQKLPVKSSHASPILRYYNFQPGDKFSFFTDSFLVGLRYQFWDQYEILNRTDGFTSLGDEITYTLTHQRLAKSWFTGPGTNGTVNTVLSPATTYTYTVASNDYFPEGNLLTNSFLEDAPYTNLGTVHVKTGPSPLFHQRQTSTHIIEQLSSNCHSFYHMLDHNGSYEYTEGLGKTFYYFDELTNPTLRILQAYIKGTETYGTWPNLATIMGTEKELEPASFSAFPNPFSNDLTLKCSATFKGQNATVSILNTLGQEIFKSAINASPNQEIKLNLPEMAKGLYVLRVTENGKTLTSRLVKE